MLKSLFRKSNGAFARLAKAVAILRRLIEQASRVMFSLIGKLKEDAEQGRINPFMRPLKNGPWRQRLENPRFYFAGVLGMIIVLVLWSSVARVDQVVRVEGKIIPAGRSQQIQHLEGGILAGISTSEGASVKQGDLLLMIDDTTAGANLSETKVKIDSLMVRVKRLEAEVNKLDEPKFPEEFQNMPVADAERKLFDMRRSKLAQEIAVNQNVIDQRTAEIAEATHRHERLVSELATATQRLDMVLAMAKNGAAAKLEVLDAQSRQQRLKTEMGDVDAIVPKAKAAIAEQRARIDALRAEFSSQAQNDLVAAMAEIERLKQIETTATDRLKRTEIRAPIDGIVNRISVNTVGGVVKPGESLIELTPTSREILIEARALPRDRGHLRSGLPAQIRVSAYDTSEFGILAGKVTEVSADSIQDPKGESFYQVNILVNKVEGKYAHNPLVPGMTVTADIVTGDRTMMSYLTSPLHKFAYNMFRDPK